MEYAVEQRMRMIDFLLGNYGHVGRQQLIAFFGIGEACATRDFKAYNAANPDNMVLSIVDKRYHKTNCFVSAYK